MYFQFGVLFPLGLLDTIEYGKEKLIHLTKFTCLDQEVGKLPDIERIRIRHVCDQALLQGPPLEERRLSLKNGEKGIVLRGGEGKGGRQRYRTLHHKGN